MTWHITAGGVIIVLLVLIIGLFVPVVFLILVLGGIVLTLISLLAWKNAWLWPVGILAIIVGLIGYILLVIR